MYQGELISHVLSDKLKYYVELSAMPSTSSR